jgi:hypothetical protein
MNSSYIYFLIFFCIGYLIVTDSSVAKAFYILTQYVRIQYEKAKWSVLYSPDNPIVRWMVWRRAYKLAEELQKELAKKQENI